MPDNPDEERFDRLLDAMVNKPPLDVKPKDEPAEEDFREDEAE
ncbi:hypothetical protein [Brevundimonas sp. UBA7664]|nr:hypothetical protein [Brevundimonas sp. UBA7664]